MPWRKQFKTNEEYNAWYREYRKRNIEKMRSYARKYNKKWRKKFGYHNEDNWKRNNPWKYNAQQALRYAVKKGKIIKKPCTICGSLQSMAHHPDYEKRLEIIWLCALHHKEIHKKLSTFRA